jgi:hypothetical protein
MSIDELTAAVFTAGVPITFAVFVWLRRECRCLPWARTAAVVAAASGIVAASLSFIASRANALDLTGQTCLVLLASKHTLKGRVRRHYDLRVVVETLEQDTGMSFYMSGLTNRSSQPLAVAMRAWIYETVFDVSNARRRQRRLSRFSLDPWLP